MGKLIVECETGKVSDGYHTFDELYEHRIILFIALCKFWESDRAESVWPSAKGRKRNVWRSKLHSDGSNFEGWFILGISKIPGEQMSYHLPMSKWADTDFAETLDRAPEWDGHTPNDVLERLRKL